MTMENASNYPLLSHKVQPEYHEHPWFNGQYHRAEWAVTWTSGGTNDEPPLDAPMICLVCGRSYAN